MSPATTGSSVWQFRFPCFPVVGCLVTFKLIKMTLCCLKTLFAHPLAKVDLSAKWPCVNVSLPAGHCGTEPTRNVNRHPGGNRSVGNTATHPGRNRKKTPGMRKVNRIPRKTSLVRERVSSLDTNFHFCATSSARGNWIRMVNFGLIFPASANLTERHCSRAVAGRCQNEN